jgi:integrase
LTQLIERYEASLPKGAIEESTRYTIRIHTGRLKELLGADFPVRALTRDDLQRYINSRAKKKGQRGKPLSPITIRKEITTLSGIWSWAVTAGLVNPFPNKGLRYPKSSEKPPFQTWNEIERQIDKGGLSEEEQAQLWDCLFLTLDEIVELLEYVRTAAQQPFIYPMFVMAAHTGARRSELIRSRRSDFDDETVVIRERKRSKGRHTTRRVPLSPLLTEVIQAWLKEHPGGPYMFCQLQVEHSKKTRQEPQPITRDEAHDHFKRTLNGSKWSRLRGWHVLRHSFISNCAMKGIDQRIIDSFVGHTTDEMRRRYTHLFPSSKKAAIETVFGPAERGRNQGGVAGRFCAN